LTFGTLVGILKECQGAIVRVWRGGMVVCFDYSIDSCLLLSPSTMTVHFRRQ
jgi:hypothetical protein